MKPKLSIVILTYNRWISLSRCIEKIIQNTHHPFEIIVVDNGSADGTPKLVELIFPAVKLISLQGNQGGWTRNYGFELANGEFIAQIDDDVNVWSKWDQILLKYLSAEIGLVGPQGWIFTNWERPNEGKKAENGQFCDFLTGFCWMMRNEPGFRYDERFGYWHEDLSLSFRIKSLGWRIRQSFPCGNHLAMRPSVDWTAHDRGLDLVRENWMESDQLKLEEFDQQDFLKKLAKK